MVRDRRAVTSGKARVAVILAAHGEAETTRFTDNFSMTRHTLAHAAEEMPIPAALRLLISLLSGLRNSREFRKTGYEPPHNDITRRQARAVAEMLDRHADAAGLAFELFPAFSATPPFLEEVLEKTRPFDARVMLSLSPVENRFTCGALCRHLQDGFSGDELAAARVVSRFWQDGALCDIYRDHLFGRFSGVNAPELTNPTLILAFHGTLVKDAKGRPPSFHTGHEETQAFASMLKRSFEADARNMFREVEIAYLNHDVGGEWSRPGLAKLLDGLKKRGVTDAAFFAAGYFADGNETLVRAKSILEESGLERTVAIPCINDSPAFCGFLTERIIMAARQVAAWKSRMVES